MSSQGLKYEDATGLAVTTEDDCTRTLHEAAVRLDESPSKAAYEDLEPTPASATIATATTPRKR